MSVKRSESSARKSTVAAGKDAEEFACGKLLEAGWTVERRNFRSRRGEVDIIAMKGDVLAFIEVKSLNRCTLLDLQHVIGAKKRHLIIETSKLFLAMNRKYNQHRIRYDVILVQENACVRHMEGAFAEHDEAE